MRSLASETKVRKPTTERGGDVESNKTSDNIDSALSGFGDPYYEVQVQILDKLLSREGEFETVLSLSKHVSRFAGLNPLSLTANACIDLERCELIEFDKSKNSVAALIGNNAVSATGGVPPASSLRS